MQERPDNGVPQPGRQGLFLALVLVFPILILAAAEGGLRAAGYGHDLDIIIQAPGDIYAKYQMLNPAVGLRYFAREEAAPRPPVDLFLKTKPANGYRIFVLGESTTRGFPYGENLMFSRILQRRLADTFPDRHIEVVNAAITATNSYTMLDLVEGLLEASPDALIIYGGHNEFYGALGVGSSESLGRYRPLVRAYLWLQHLRLFQLLRQGITGLQNLADRAFLEGTVNDPSATLMERMSRDRMIPYQASTYLAGRNQFEANLRSLLAQARDRGVTVVLSELVSNVRDQAPFASAPAGQDPPAASLFVEARALDRDRQYLAAHSLYVRAKDLDALRFRATEDFNELIRGLGREFAFPVVPMVQAFESASPAGIVGDPLMIDHLHPNEDGYFLMADAVYSALRAHGLIGPGWDRAGVPDADSYRARWPVTELDRITAQLRVRMLKERWPFTPGNARSSLLEKYRPTGVVEQFARRIALETDLNLLDGHYRLAEHYERRGMPDQALAEYEAIEAIAPWDVPPRLRAALVRIRLNDLAGAQAELEAARKLEDTTFGRRWLGHVLLRLGKPASALPLLESVRQAEQGALFRSDLATAYAHIGRCQSARQVLHGGAPPTGGLQELLDSRCPPTTARR